MESSSQKTLWSADLILVTIFTLLIVAFVFFPSLKGTFIRTILGVLFVLFIPGYSLISALFPRDDMDGIERAVLSFVLSIVVTPLIGLALNYTPWGIRLDLILISLTYFTLIMIVVAYLRRKKLPAEERFAVPFSTMFFSGFKARIKGESRTEVLLSVILIIAMLLAISTTAYVIVKPKQGEKFTEFYLLGPDGKAGNYPTNLTAGQQAKLIIGVINHEYATTNYQLVVKMNNNTLTNETIRLQNNAKKEIPFTFTANPPGQDKMEFLLYKSPNSQNVYRSLHLWLNVT